MFCNQQKVLHKLNGHPVLKSIHCLSLLPFLTNDGAVADAGEALDDEPGAGHLGQPVVVGAVQPVVLVLVGRDGEGADLVALPVQLLMQ